MDLLYNKYQIDHLSPNKTIRKSTKITIKKESEVQLQKRGWLSKEMPLQSKTTAYIAEVRIFVLQVKRK